MLVLVLLLLLLFFFASPTAAPLSCVRSDVMGCDALIRRRGGPGPSLPLLILSVIFNELMNANEKLMILLACPDALLSVRLW